MVRGAGTGGGGGAAAAFLTRGAKGLLNRGTKGAVLPLAFHKDSNEVKRLLCGMV